MAEVQYSALQRYYPKKMHLLPESVVIETMVSNDEAAVVELIRRNLSCFDKRAQVVASTHQRLRKFFEVYKRKGCRLYVVKPRSHSEEPIGCIGLGPLHGLSMSEGVGEIRDLVVEVHYRGRGLASKLLHLCITDAKKMGYKRLYLESSPDMIKAHRLFRRAGFKPVTDRAQTKDGLQDHEPSYFLMEDL